MVHVGKVCVLRSDKEIHEKDPGFYRIPTIDFQRRGPVCISSFRWCLSTGIFNLVCPWEVAPKPTCNDALNVLYVWGCAREYLSNYQISLCWSILKLYVLHRPISLHCENRALARTAADEGRESNVEKASQKKQGRECKGTGHTPSSQDATIEHEEWEACLSAERHVHVQIQRRNVIERWVHYHRLPCISAHYLELKAGRQHHVLKWQHDLSLNDKTKCLECCRQHQFTSFYLGICNFSKIFWNLIIARDSHSNWLTSEDTEYNLLVYQVSTFQF
jgi:hypothetical protein